MAEGVLVPEESKKMKDRRGFERNGTEDKGKGREWGKAKRAMAKERNDEEEERRLELGPWCTLKEQFEKDKDDESLRRWKEQLLGTLDFESIGEKLEPEVKILSLAIKSPGRDDMVLPIPEDGKPKGLWFTLKEGSKYSLQFTFKVSNNIVSGLKYTNTVWKTGVI
ncbi:hypothetical protein PTKIN_Ptkin05aG0124000 [Pterospermum kingtungense]